MLSNIIRSSLNKTTAQKLNKYNITENNKKAPRLNNVLTLSKFAQKYNNIQLTKAIDTIGHVTLKR